MATHDLPEVRMAVPEDENEIMKMCRDLHRENGLFSLNEDKVRTCLHKCWERKGVVVGVIGEPGHLEASTCLMISDFYYTDDWHLAELWNFVDEPFRRSRNAEALIEFGKACSDKMRVPFFTGIVTDKKMAMKVRLYRRSLGSPTGAFFVYNAKWKTEPIEDHTELGQQLREFAKMCNDNKVTTTIARKEVGPLLRKAAEAVTGADNIWGTPRKPNGAHADSGAS